MWINIAIFATGLRLGLTRFERSLNQARNEIDDIFEEYEDDDTYEIYGEIGGDAVHYVIMKDDGAIYEK